MSIYKRVPRKRSLSDLAKRPADVFGWEWEYARKEELDYVAKLSPKELLAYRQEREEEAFIDNI